MSTRSATLIALLLLPGCVDLGGLGGPSRPTTFYLLSSLVSDDPEALADASPDGPAVGVGPVELPAHLNRPQIVTRAEDNRLDLAEFQKWGEPLREGFTRVLAEDLAVLLKTQRVVAYPWSRRTPIDHRLRVDVLRFSAGPGDAVQLRCRWTLYDGKGRPAATRVTQVSEPAPVGDYDAVVAAMSRTVEALAREVAQTIQADAG
jgi:hypothetical protein